MSRLSIRFLIGGLIALILTIIPLPSLVEGFRPFWVLMFVLYFQFYRPGYFGVTGLFFLGLILDVLLSSVMGEHVCALLLTLWVAESKMRRFEFLSIAQQMICITVLSMLYQTVIVLVDSSLGYNTEAIFALEAILTSVLCWPWIKLLLDNLLLSIERYR